MLLKEANERLKVEKINEEQLAGLNSLYVVLDLEKDDFCKIVDAVGVQTLMSKRCVYERLDKAEQALSAKERYLDALDRLDELERERKRLESIVSNYNLYT